MSEDVLRQTTAVQPESPELYPYVATLIGINKKAWHLIDRVYDQYNEQLYPYGKKSVYWQTVPIITLPAEPMLYARKLLCMFEYLASTKDNTREVVEDIDPELVKQIRRMVEEIYKKVYPGIYWVFQKESKIKLYRVMRDVLLDNIVDFGYTELPPEYETYYALMLVVFGAEIFGREIVKDEVYKMFLELHQSRVRYYFGDNSKKPRFDTLRSKIQEGIELKKRIQELEDRQDLEKIKTLNEKNLLDVLPKNTFMSPFREIEENWEKLSVIVADIFDLFDLGLMELLDTTTDDEDVGMVYTFINTCLNMYNDRSQSKKLEIAHELATFLYPLWALLKEYRNLRERYTDVYYENMNLKHQLAELKQLKSEIERLKKQEQMYTEVMDKVKEYERMASELTILKQELKKLGDENLLLKRENNHLTQELEEYKEDMYELAQLREAIFTWQTDDIDNAQDTNKQELLSPEDLQVLRGLKIGIVGGYRGQFDKIADYFDDFVHIEAGRTKYDESVFSRLDLVVFMIKILDHSSYYRAMNIIKQYGKPFLIVNCMNQSRMISEIVKWVKNNKTDTKK